MNEASRALDQIRHTELDAARLLEDAREKSALIIAEASARARALVDEGRERGRAEAHRRYNEEVAKAEAEAERIQTQAISEAEELIGSIETQIAPLVDRMVEEVLAVTDEAGN